MKRLLLILVLVLGALVLGEHALRVHREKTRARAGRLRLLSRVPAGAVRRIQLRPGLAPQSWTYVRRHGIWRYPARFDAYVLSARIDHLLGSLLQSPGTLVSTDPEARPHFGLAPAQALRVRLEGAGGKLLLEVLVGRGAPGGEAYVQLAGERRIYHLHANPRLALNRAIPPMLDPRVFPGALAGKTTVEVRYEGEHPVQGLHRVERTPRPGLPPRGPRYAWLATRAGREDTCIDASAFAYIGFLSRLRYETLRDPRGKGYGFAAGARLRLVDEDGAEQTLEVGRAEGGQRFVRHLPSRQVFTLDARKAALLFPAPETLLDTLPRPSPYQVAESRTDE